MATIYGVHSIEEYGHSTLALSIIVMSIFGLELALAIFEFAQKELYENSVKFKCIAKILPMLIHIAVWISVQVYVFDKDLDCRDSKLICNIIPTIAWRAFWVVLVAYVGYVYLLLLLNVVYWIILFRS